MQDEDESDWNTWVTENAWHTGNTGDTTEIRTAIGDMAEFLEDAHRLVVLTGAGVSTESGIPDFRGPNGIWSRRPSPTYRAFMQDPAARREYWRTRRELAGLLTRAQPNAAHYALAEMERRGILAGIITQNFDGLHQEAGSNPGSVVELHGTSREAACQNCGARLVMAEVQARVDAGDEDPLCDCGGFLKAATILFGQPVHRPVLDTAFALARTCDLFLVVGSSLRVVPAARLPLLALERGVPLLIINLEPTPLDSRADSVLHAPASHVLAHLLALLPTSA
jgi:NAD-dependent deacetylase